VVNQSPGSLNSKNLSFADYNHIFNQTAMARRRQPFVFPTDSETVRNRTQLPANAELDAGRKYQQYARDYLNEDFSYECYQFIANICRSVENSSLRGDFPVRSILIAISKKLLLN